MSGEQVGVDLDEIRRLICDILDVPVQPAHGLTRSEVAAWDSLKHMELVFALEDRYDVRFDEAEFARLDSPASIAMLVRHHLAT